MAVHHPGYRSPERGLVDPERASHILEYLLREGAIDGRRIHRPAPAPISALARVHSVAYLQSLDDEGLVARVFGLERLEAGADAVVAHQRLMVGGTLTATRLALAGSAHARREPLVAVNLGGGFHHAFADHGEGFCIFNDVAIAICDARARGFSGRVLVVDVDLHPGNGTRAILGDDSEVFTFSLHATEWDPAPERVRDLSIALGADIRDRDYLAALDEGLDQVLAQWKPDLVFYVAGVDLAHDDTLGNYRLSHDSIFARDRLVVERVARSPVVWLLAGGYGAEAWRHSARSLSYVGGGPPDAIPSQTELGLRRFRRIARRLSEDDLTEPHEGDVVLSFEDLLMDREQRRRPTRLLGYYSRYGIEVALQHYGVIAKLRDRGYPEVRLELDLGHDSGELMRIRSADADQLLLIELIVKEEQSWKPFRLLWVEWLLLQHPRATATADRGLLPGQEHPGLGLLHEIIGMLVMACERLGFDGVAFAPSAYHIAAIARAHAVFLEPEREGLLRALEAVIGRLPLGSATVLLGDGRVVDDRSGTSVAWDPGPMVIPFSERLHRHLDATDYRQAVARTAEAFQFRIVDAGSTRGSSSVPAMPPRDRG